MAATATLTATSLEGQVVETLREMQQAEDAWIAAGLALPTPVTRPRRVTATPNLVAGTITYSVTMPITTTDNANGYTIVAAPYLP